MQGGAMAEAQEPIQGSLADSIAMLEQILEVMPQDVEAIKAVYNAYAQGGHGDRAFAYLGRLVEVVLGGGEPEAVAFVRQELPRYEDEFPSEVAAQIARLRAMSGESGGAASGRGGQVAVEQSQGEIDITEELALAWRLYEEEQLSQEEYSSVIHDLTEVSSKDVDVPVTVLHVLYDRGFGQINRVMGHISSRAGTPFINIGSYELDADLARALPEQISVRDGAIPFSFLGDDLLVGVLNPFNTGLMEKVESVSGRRCHAYLVEPSDYDAALGKLKELASPEG
jgi:hypothetical protein